MRFIAFLLTAVAMAQPAHASEQQARAAVVRVLPILQKSAQTFVRKQSCFSCHHNALSVMTLRLADQRGIRIDPAVLDAVETKTFRELRSATSIDDAIQAAGVSDPTPNESLLLMSAHAAGMPADLTTAVIARRLAHWQRPDGRWMTSDFRPPHSSSEFTATATAVRAIATYMPPELVGERDAVLRRAATWLTTTWPNSTEDATFRLLGLIWAGAPAETIASAARTLLSMQQPAGGWSQLPGYAADAYSTGEALYALRAAGVATATPEWQRGARFLITTQAADGTWHVRTRMISPADISPPYFHTGFPYAKDEFLSYAGTCWAVMALLSSLPETPATIAPAAPGTATAPGWLRAALFGSAKEMATALAGGLDPNSKTAAGTTVLMASALDADTTRLLIAHGADVHARGRSGMDALTIAATHVGTAASVAALLDAGADAQPPEGVRVRHSPIVAASLAGDPDTVAVLLKHGAKPSGQAISEAITFGHHDVVATLISAGGDVTGVDGTGVNLLHWAAITNRDTIIPLLANAGVPINALDDAGYTPLMYAATVDQGDQRTLKALLAAGANPGIKNDDGRTPLQQARRLGHADAVRALSR
ncbi:MAG TPA: ankyrin repeat domain-containing protein [Vicinamibacterales bacterium]|nr:ankyrin repeat domain-containing protein [Vicinamibacterales bacterium]